ncbi:RBP11-like subunit of RNA polymerase [Dacryopinax primogenitus]|uniref:DNA-directed RNA polymerases I and III subunit RPAC2 n=1 Tax=Dacryopinax primogenitus (strain DJM 731) TaxID=1858805 RepID=M5G8Q3_DACPD|nr:RBP11-like subunit of RNA polymerase [Dacryopinax primogenitus]EJU02222.1 RBP11-like subunit of RNA polymerase [Dacryopinax primogenitus]
MSNPPPDDGSLRYVPDGPKISVLPGHTTDYSHATFCIEEEDHTLGNALRWMIMKNPKVEFCGYSMPHPSEYKINLRIQMYDNASSLDALALALKQLDDLAGAIEEEYNASLEGGEWEQGEDGEMDLEGAKRYAAEVKKRREKEAKEGR